MSNPQELQILKTIRDQYATDVVGFAYDIMRVDYLTNQQEQFLRELGEYIYCNAYQQSAEEYAATLMNPRLQTNPQLQRKLDRLAADLEGHELTKEQKGKYVRKDGFSISSGRDTGKSCVLSIIAWWFLCSFEEPQGYIIAPSGQQAKAILMAEIAKWGNRQIENEHGVKENAFLYRDQFELLAESIRFKSAPTERFIEVKKVDDKSSKEDQITSMSGFHSPQQLFLIDEAIKQPDHIIETINATNTKPLNFSIMIFNPVRAESYAVRSVFGEKTEGWISMVWNCEKSDKPGMREHVEKLKQEYGGTENDLYRVNVQGQPERNSSEAMFPMHSLEMARTRESLFPSSQYITIGHDVAGEGNDNAATVVVRGKNILEMHIHQGKTDFWQVDFLYELYKKYSPQEINIDTIGIGRSVYALLKAKECHVARPIVVSKKATKNSQKYPLLRDQFYFRLRDLFKDEKISFNMKSGEKHYSQLRRELVATGFNELDGGQHKVYPKKKIKENLNGKSPDIADALMLAFSGKDYDVEYSHGLSDYNPDPWHQRLDEEEAYDRISSYSGEKSWMCS